jgi:hypothetical protein
LILDSSSTLNGFRQKEHFHFVWPNRVWNEACGYPVWINAAQVDPQNCHRACYGTVALKKILFWNAISTLFYHRSVAYKTPYYPRKINTNLNNIFYIDIIYN